MLEWRRSPFSRSDFYRRDCMVGIGAEREIVVIGARGVYLVLFEVGGCSAIMCIHVGVARELMN